MSYTPTLFIKKSDLVKNEKKIEKGIYHKKEETQKAYEELNVALNKGTIKFPELELVVIQPEFSGLNNDVRGLMKKLKIDFREEA